MLLESDHGKYRVERIEFGDLRLLPILTILRIRRWQIRRIDGLLKCSAIRAGNPDDPVQPNQWTD